MELLIRQRCQLALRKRAEQQVRLERATFPALILEACQQTWTWLILTIWNANGHTHTSTPWRSLARLTPSARCLGSSSLEKGRGKGSDSLSLLQSTAHACQARERGSSAARDAAFAAGAAARIIHIRVQGARTSTFNHSVHHVLQLYASRVPSSAFAAASSFQFRPRRRLSYLLLLAQKMVRWLKYARQHEPVHMAVCRTASSCSCPR